MKYIDAERLKAEITKERKSIEGLFIEGDNNFYDGQDDAYNHVLALIDSLQQEQLEVEFNKELDSFYDSPLLEGETISFMSYTRIANHFYELGKNSK